MLESELQRSKERLEETTWFWTRAGNVNMNSFQPSYDTAKGPKEMCFPMIELLHTVTCKSLYVVYSYFIS